MKIDISKYPAYRTALAHIMSECDHIMDDSKSSNARKSELMGKVVLKYTG